MKSWIVVSGSSPTSTAYERTNARPKMPPGSREMSLRSSASSTATEIFVALAICRNDTPRRSRAARNLPPKSPMGRSADMYREKPRSMLGSRFQAVNEEPDGRDAGRAGGDHRDGGRAHDRAQAVHAKHLGRVWLRRRGKHRPRDEVVRA